MGGVRGKQGLWLPEAECTGCGACENICPVGALTIRLSEGGHLLPLIGDACTGCSACERVCEERFGEASDRVVEPGVYATWSKDPSTRFSSTSGGAFSELARAVLRSGGIVFGAAYDASNDVVCASAEDEGGLQRLRQSKYVQSATGLAFREVRDRLREGRRILFCGAPCQVAGLRAYLGRDYENLICIDFVCRGVNSPKAYRAWLSELEREHGSSVSRVWFKYKEGGWKTSPRRTRVDFSDGSCLVQDQEENLFMCGYLGPNLYLRESCTECAFKGFPRQGDLTVADFWGLDEELDDDKGTTMLLVSSERGRRLLDEARQDLEVHERAFSSIFAGNVCIEGSAAWNPKSPEFLAALDRMGFSEAVRAYSREGVLAKARRKMKALARKVANHG